MRTSWARPAAVVILAGVMAGCYESAFPLDPEPRVDVDPALTAVWRCLPMDAEPTETAATLTITRGTAARTYAATWQDEGDSPDHYDAFASAVDGVTYLNVRERAAAAASTRGSSCGPRCCARMRCTSRWWPTRPWPGSRRRRRRCVPPCASGGRTRVCCRTGRSARGPGRRRERRLGRARPGVT